MGWEGAATQSPACGRPWLRRRPGRHGLAHSPRRLAESIQFRTGCKRQHCCCRCGSWNRCKTRTAEQGGQTAVGCPEQHWLASFPPCSAFTAGVLHTRHGTDFSQHPTPFPHSCAVVDAAEAWIAGGAAAGIIHHAGGTAWDIARLAAITLQHEARQQAADGLSVAGLRSLRRLRRPVEHRQSPSQTWHMQQHSTATGTYHAIVPRGTLCAAVLRAEQRFFRNAGSHAVFDECEARIRRLALHDRGQRQPGWFSGMAEEAGAGEHRRVQAHDSQCLRRGQQGACRRCSRLRQGRLCRRCSSRERWGSTPSRRTAPPRPPPPAAAGARPWPLEAPNSC